MLIMKFRFNGGIMENYSKKSKLVAALATLGLLSVVGTAQATLFEIDFTTAGAFSGTAPSSPGSNTVFAKAVFDDHGSSGTVTLTMSVLNNLSAGAYVNDWYFNSSTAPLTSINFVSGTQALTVDNGTNAFKADGTGGKFDFAFHFPTSNPGELAQGHTSVYTLIDTGITANSFNSSSVNGGPYVSALHVQGYGNSVWTSGTGLIQIPQNPVPEPATLALLGLGLFALGVTRRRKQ
jgi:hypothetical protein